MTILGLDGWAVPLGMLLSIGSALLCLVYGALNWNRGKMTELEWQRHCAWEAEEEQANEELLR